MSQLTLLIELKKTERKQKNWRQRFYRFLACATRKVFYVSYRPMKASNIAYRKPSKGSQKPT